MKIFLVRHGETDWNLQRRFQGREDIALNDTGIKQAAYCGIALKGDIIKAIITSPLSRAKRTAEIMAENLLVDQVIIEEEITERDFSKVSGMTPKEREVFYASGEEDDKEPWEDMLGRMISSIKKYAERYHGGNIIMISHGASINSVLSTLSGGTTGTGKILLKNACINIINYEKGLLSLEAFNLSADDYLKLKREENRTIR